MRQHNAAFANFICRFGEDKVLLDYAEQIVIPAFTRDTYIRSHGERTHYHFYNVKLVKLENQDNVSVSVFALAGRFVKDTKLTRHQIFDEKKGLVQDEQSMRSSPSAYFVLLLNNHRLIYFPETPHAPDFKSFEATSRQFLRKMHREYIERLYDKFTESDEKVTKKFLYECHPRATLEIIPLTGRQDIEQFIRQYEVLKRIDFRLVRPNDDINAEEILQQVRELGQELNSEKTEVTVANTDGLDLEGAIDAVSVATQTGNQDLKLSGVDQEGNHLLGNNEQFQISSPLENVPAGEHELISQLYGIYNRLILRGTILAPNMDEQLEKTRRLEGLI